MLVQTKSLPVEDFRDDCRHIGCFPGNSQVLKPGRIVLVRPFQALQNSLCFFHSLFNAARGSFWLRYLFNRVSVGRYRPSLVGTTNTHSSIGSIVPRKCITVAYVGHASRTNQRPYRLAHDVRPVCYRGKSAVEPNKPIWSPITGRRTTLHESSWNFILLILDADKTFKPLAASIWRDSSFVVSN